MKQQYILPNTYATEAEHLKAYKAVLRKEKPSAKLIAVGKINLRYYANTSIGTVFFQIRNTIPLTLEFENAHFLSDYILL